MSTDEISGYSIFHKLKDRTKFYGSLSYGARKTWKITITTSLCGTSKNVNVAWLTNSCYQKSFRLHSAIHELGTVIEFYGSMRYVSTIIIYNSAIIRFDKCDLCINSQVELLFELIVLAKTMKWTRGLEREEPQSQFLGCVFQMNIYREATDPHKGIYGLLGLAKGIDDAIV